MYPIFNEACSVIPKCRQNLENHLLEIAFFSPFSAVNMCYLVLSWTETFSVISSILPFSLLHFTHRIDLYSVFLLLA